jgi:hypothetical protein
MFQAFLHGSVLGSQSSVRTNRLVRPRLLRPYGVEPHPQVSRQVDIKSTHAFDSANGTLLGWSDSTGTGEPREARSCVVSNRRLRAALLRRPWAEG